MKNISLAWIIIFSFLLGISACKKSEEPTPEPPGPTDKYEQYGTPFADVPATEDIIMYEVNLRAFSQGGDLQGVIDRLDNLAELGVNVIWLMPLHPIGQVNSVNSPYSVKDHKAVGAEYGTLNDLRNLTDEAHSRGMAVIMDWVANHTAWDNAWIAHKSWYTQDGDGNIVHPPGTNWLDVADLNYDNDTMRLAMIDAMEYWLYVANVDGYRCDYADGVPFDFWTQALDTLHKIPGREFIFFAEGSRKDHFTAGFDLNFGIEFFYRMKDVFDGQTVNTIFTAHNSEYSGIPAGKHWLRYTTNHDESAWNETPISMFNGVNGALAASVVAIFTGGVPLIYTGQEVGTAENVPFFSNSPINWENNPEMLTTYQDIFQFYAGSDVARTGTNTVYQNADVFCIKKALGVEELLVIVQTRNGLLNYILPEELQNTEWIDALSNENVSLSGTVTLLPYDYLILKH